MNEINLDFTLYENRQTLKSLDENSFFSQSNPRILALEGFLTINRIMQGGVNFEINDENFGDPYLESIPWFVVKLISCIWVTTLFKKKTHLWFEELSVNLFFSWETDEHIRIEMYHTGKFVKRADVKANHLFSKLKVFYARVYEETLVLYPELSELPKFINSWPWRN